MKIKVATNLLLAHMKREERSAYAGSDNQSTQYTKVLDMLKRYPTYPIREGKYTWYHIDDIYVEALIDEIRQQRRNKK